MKATQFTIRDLLLSTVLIALGIGILSAAYRVPDHHVPFYSVAAFFCIPLSGPLIGAGLFLPFGKARLGAIWGLLVMVTLLCIVADVQPTVRE